MAENPYAPPRAEINVGAPAEIAAPIMKMPGTVIAALVFVCLLAAVEIVSGLLTQQIPYIRFTISVLLILGFLRGHALAWQWGIVIPILVTVLLLVSLGAVYSRLISLQAILLGATAIAFYLPIPVLLWFRRSRQYFGLECPKCHQVSTRARSFFFTKRQCNVCKFEWTPVRR
jgi:hypothetical protein